MRIWPEKGSLLAFLQKVCCCPCILLEGVSSLLMGVHSDPLGHCFSSVSVTHLQADPDLLFPELKSQPDYKGKDLKLSGKTTNMTKFLSVI